MIIQKIGVDISETIKKDNSVEGYEMSDSIMTMKRREVRESVV